MNSSQSKAKPPLKSKKTTESKRPNSKQQKKGTSASGLKKTVSKKMRKDSVVKKKKTIVSQIADDAPCQNARSTMQGWKDDAGSLDDQSLPMQPLEHPLELKEAGEPIENAQQKDDQAEETGQFQTANQEQAEGPTPVAAEAEQVKNASSDHEQDPERKPDEPEAEDGETPIDVFSQKQEVGSSDAIKVQNNNNNIAEALPIMEAPSDREVDQSSIHFYDRTPLVEDDLKSVAKTELIGGKEQREADFIANGQEVSRRRTYVDFKDDEYIQTPNPQSVHHETKKLSSDGNSESGAISAIPNIPDTPSSLALYSLKVLVSAQGGEDILALAVGKAAFEKKGEKGETIDGLNASAQANELSHENASAGEVGRELLQDLKAYLERQLLDHQRLQADKELIDARKEQRLSRACLAVSECAGELLGSQFTAEMKKAWVAVARSFGSDLQQEESGAGIQPEAGASSQLQPLPIIDNEPSGAIQVLREGAVLSLTWEAATASNPALGRSILMRVIEQAPDSEQELRHAAQLGDGPEAHSGQSDFATAATDFQNSIKMAVEVLDANSEAPEEARKPTPVVPLFKKMSRPLLQEVMLAIMSQLQVCLCEEFTDEAEREWKLALGSLGQAALQQQMEEDLKSTTEQSLASQPLEKEDEKEEQGFQKAAEQATKVSRPPPQIRLSHASEAPILQARVQCPESSASSPSKASSSISKRKNTVPEIVSHDLTEEKNPPVRAPTSGSGNLKIPQDTMRTTQVKMVIKKHYQDKFKSEVDFHHKIQFRFEKAFRLAKTMPEKARSLNLEIIDLISEFSEYIDHDPMAIFYCLYFCIYYNNEDMVEFLRDLIKKLPSVPRIDKLIEFIDIYGIPKLRSVGQQISQLVYHMVFYQAVDDQLRVVYHQIINKLKFIQLRDKDALHLLNKRDYELIRLSFSRYTTKINLQQFYPKSTHTLKASTYRKYNQAYFEEIVLSNHIEERVALNYRERFIVSPEDIYIVFEMYCKEDYDEQFQSTRKDDITHKQFLELFVICLRNDSFKIALLIYTLYLKPSEDINERILDILIGTIRDSTRFHEMKLFYLHQHFQSLSMLQMTHIIDIYDEILHRKPDLNPIVSQFNTIKIALLIYRICWKIEGRQIYSLITKCTALQNYLMASVVKFLEKQTNVLILHKLMTEPILHISERKDCLDIMAEMNIQPLLKHPMVVEVLNLVYEGKYSTSSTALSMSQTFFCMFDMELFGPKSIGQRLLLNIKTFGDMDSSKQSSLQYNIWKHSIEQRQQDEMVFSVLINFGILCLSLMVALMNNITHRDSMDTFKHDILENSALLLMYDDPSLLSFCKREIDHLLTESVFLDLLTGFALINFLGVLTNVLTRILNFWYRENVSLNYGIMAFDAISLFNSFLFLYTVILHDNNPLMKETCAKFTGLESGVDKVDHVFSLQSTYGGNLDFNLVISVLVIQAVLLMISMLQRNHFFGQLIVMLSHLLTELVRFVATFGLVIVLFVVTGTILGQEFHGQGSSLFQIFLDLFNAMNGNQDLEVFQITLGKIYSASFMYMFKVLFLSLLAAMFINKYKTTHENIDAIKRLEVIRLKNAKAFNRYIGGASLSFYPMNIFISPLLLPIMISQSPRLSEFALKMQYTMMMAAYCFLGLLLAIPMIPVLYFKIVANAVYIWSTRHREEYRCQNWVQLALAILLSPFLIFVSLAVDILALPSVLMKPSNSLAHKYQFQENILTPEQVETMIYAMKLVFSKYDSQWKGTAVTLNALMSMHRQKFKLAANLHDLTCLGNLDVQQALANVQEYNLSKLLSTKCSIPDESGQFKLSRVNVDVVFTIYKDVGLYNYADIVLRKIKMGTLREQITSKETCQASMDSQKAEPRALSEMQFKAMKAAQKRKEKEEQEKLEEEDSDIDMTQSNFYHEGPDNVPLWRHQDNMLNNYFVDKVSESFTNIEEIAMKEKMSKKRQKMEELEEKFKTKKEALRIKTIEQFRRGASKYKGFLQDKIMDYKLQLMKMKSKVAAEKASLRSIPENSSTASADK